MKTIGERIAFASRPWLKEGAEDLLAEEIDVAFNAEGEWLMHLLRLGRESDASAWDEAMATLSQLSTNAVALREDRDQWRARSEGLERALAHYRDDCRSCGGSGIYRVKRGGQGRHGRPEDFIESPCDVCEPARAALAPRPDAAPPTLER